MDVWQLILYVGASLLALQSLVSLMTHHRRQHRKQLLLEYQQQAGKRQPKQSASGSESVEAAA